METSCGVVLVNYGTTYFCNIHKATGTYQKVTSSILTITSNPHCEGISRRNRIREIEFGPGFENTTEYSFKYKGKRTRKQVYWYLATTDEITVKLSIEHRDYMWLDWSLALDLATHPETKSVISEAKLFADACRLP